MYLFAICVSFLVKCLLSILAHFKNWIVYLLLNFKTYLYILDIVPSSTCYFANILF